MIKQLLILIALGAVMASCNKSELKSRDYLKWYGDEENKVWTKKKVGEYEFALQYRSHEFIFLRENNGVYDKNRFSKRNEKLGNMQYYLLRIKGENENELMAENLAEDNEYYHRLEYFMGPMQDDISLIEGKDTLPCLLFHYERNYGISPNNNFLLAFEKGKEEQFLKSDKTILFNDRALGNGPVSLSIKAKDIKEMPQLAER